MIRAFGLPTILASPSRLKLAPLRQQLRQPGNAERNAPRFVARQKMRWIGPMGRVESISAIDSSDFDTVSIVYIEPVLKTLDAPRWRKTTFWLP